MQLWRWDLSAFLKMCIRDRAQIEKLGGKAVMRKSGAKADFVISDNGNIMDTDFSNVATFAGKPEELHKKLKQLTDVYKRQM